MLRSGVSPSPGQPWLSVRMPLTPSTDAVRLLSSGKNGVRACQALLPPPGWFISNVWPLTVRVTSFSPGAGDPVKIQKSVFGGLFSSHCTWFSFPSVTPLPVHGTVANAAVGRMTHVIISSVAAVTAMRPAAVSPLLCFLRSAGILPTSIVLTASATGGHLCPPLAILGPRSGLLHPPKVPACRKPFVLTFGSHPQVAQSVRAAALEGNEQFRLNGWDFLTIRTIRLALGRALEPIG
jgi:hypothetical protein